jgi:hypothetical protein
MRAGRFNGRYIAVNFSGDAKSIERTEHRHERLTHVG